MPQSQPATPPVASPQPIQFTPFRKEHFDSDHGIAFVNLQFSQLVTSLNSLFGQAGPTLLPSGVDVRGASVTGLAAPTAPSDAVSLSHAQAAFGPATQQSELDIGGAHMLKGFAYALSGIQSLSTAVATIPATPYAGGQSFTLFGLVIKLGHVSAFTGTQPVAFTAAFPNACIAALAVDDYASAAQRQMSVNQATVTSSGFTIVSSGAGNGAYWVALGW